MTPFSFICPVCGTDARVLGDNTAGCRVGCFSITRENWSGFRTTVQYPPHRKMFGPPPRVYLYREGARLHVDIDGQREVPQNGEDPVEWVESVLRRISVLIVMEA